MLLFSRKLKLSIYTSFWQVFCTVLFAKYKAVSLSMPWATVFMLMFQLNQAWRGLQTGGVWKRKVDTLYKQHQLSPNYYATAQTHHISKLTEWPRIYECCQSSRYHQKTKLLNNSGHLDWLFYRISSEMLLQVGWSFSGSLIRDGVELSRDESLLGTFLVAAS